MVVPLPLAMRIPLAALATAAVPAAFNPMMLPRMTLLSLPTSRTSIPLLALPDTRLPVPAAVPPIVLPFAPPAISTPV